MTPETVMTMGRQAMEVTLMVAAPLLLVALLIGLAVMAFGAVLFIPAARAASYPLFLLALIKAHFVQLKLLLQPRLAGAALAQVALERCDEFFDFRDVRLVRLRLQPGFGLRHGQVQRRNGAAACGVKVEGTGTGAAIGPAPFLFHADAHHAPAVHRLDALRFNRNHAVEDFNPGFLWDRWPAASGNTHHAGSC